MLQSKVLISRPYYNNEGKYTHYDKLYDMLKEDSDFFTVDKVVKGEQGGIIELYFHFTLQNEKGENQDIYMSARQDLISGYREDWFCNSGFDSDKAYNEQPGGEHYRDDDDNLQAYPKYLRTIASYELTNGRISQDLNVCNLPHSMFLVYNKNMFYYQLIPNTEMYGDYDREYNVYDITLANSLMVTTTNPLGSQSKGVFWGGGYDKTYALRLGDNWYHKNNYNNELYKNRVVAFRNAVGGSEYDTYNITNLTASSPVLLNSYVDGDGNRQYSMGGTTNVQFTNKHYSERNRDSDDRIYNSIHYYGGKRFVECEICLDTNYHLIVSEAEDIKYV